MAFADCPLVCVLDGFCNTNCETFGPECSFDLDCFNTTNLDPFGEFEDVLDDAVENAVTGIKVAIGITIGSFVLFMWCVFVICYLMVKGTTEPTQPPLTRPQCLIAQSVPLQQVGQPMKELEGAHVAQTPQLGNDYSI